MGIFEDQFVAAFRGEEPPPLPNWVEWKHISQGLSHCPVCLKLDKCWFMDENKPLLPQHPLCHYIVDPIPFSKVVDEAKAECDIRKFNAYVFHPDREKNQGKKALFEAWGYDITDSKMLQREFENQALDKYIQSGYTLGKLNEDVQRISIKVELKRKDNNEMVSFISGWMVNPNGKIRLTTPYGGKIK